MTATLVAKNVAGGFAHRTLFEGLDVTVAPGDVIGVVGANGAGKTTLLRILAGDLEPLDGMVSFAPADAFVGWLPQEHERVPGETVTAYIARRAGCTEATQAMDIALATYALAQKLGGCVGITTATVRNCSSRILRKIGGRPLEVAEQELPAYYDPQYRCDMELLRFESNAPNPKYQARMARVAEHLADLPVICARGGPLQRLSSDRNLAVWAKPPQSQPAAWQVTSWQQ